MSLYLSLVLHSTPSHLDYRPLQNGESAEWKDCLVGVWRLVPPPLEHGVRCIVIFSWEWAAVLLVISSLDYLSLVFILVLAAAFRRH